MCLGVPGKIVSVVEDSLLRSGRVEFGGVVKEICLAYTPEAEVGDWVIVHVGFAIAEIDEAEAQRTLENLHELADQVDAIRAGESDPG